MDLKYKHTFDNDVGTQETLQPHSKHQPEQRCTPSILNLKFYKVFRCPVLSSPGRFTRFSISGFLRSFPVLNLVLI